MARWTNDAALDLALGYYAECDRIFFCAGQPDTYAHASTAYDAGDNLNLATVSTGVTFTGPANDTSGRKLTVDAQASIEVTTSSTATHIALGKSGDSSLRFITTCTDKVLTDGDTINMNAWVITLPDPVAP